MSCLLYLRALLKFSCGRIFIKKVHCLWKVCYRFCNITAPSPTCIYAGVNLMTGKGIINCIGFRQAQPGEVLFASTPAALSPLLSPFVPPTPALARHPPRRDLQPRQVVWLFLRDGLITTDGVGWDHPTQFHPWCYDFWTIVEKNFKQVFYVTNLPQHTHTHSYSNTQNVL